jgi:protoporphyrinogen IX oxidase
MLWIKSLHVIFVVSWFAGLFYLPRLFVYHAQAEDEPSRDRFKVMERRLYRGIMTPAMILTIASGLWLWLAFGFAGAWLYTKVFLVVLLVAYHFWMRRLMRDFALERNKRDHKFYRWVNEVPTVLLVAVVVLAVVKPF